MDAKNFKKADTELKTDSQMVWDLPVRVFHWSLVTLFFVAWFTSEGDRWLDIHLFAGYAVFGLILFRLVWGLTGTHFARFSSFSYSFEQAKDYAISAIKGKQSRFIGHNPAGSWAIYFMLAGLALVVISGLFVFGGEEGHGVASSLFSELFGWLAKNAHNALASLIMGLVVVHVGGVFVESYHLKEKLVLSMFSGRKRVPAGTPTVATHKTMGLVIVGILVIYVLSAGLGLIPGKEVFQAQFTGADLAKSKVWQEECGACHLAFQPGLLPTRSWNKLLTQQHQHFGEDLYLEDSTLKQLNEFAAANSANKELTELARKIMDWDKPSVTLLRITQTGYWQKKHGEIAPEIWKQSNVNGKGQCASCHSDAKQGWFEDSKMKIPDSPATKAPVQTNG